MKNGRNTARNRRDSLRVTSVRKSSPKHKIIYADVADAGRRSREQSSHFVKRRRADNFDPHFTSCLDNYRNNAVSIPLDQVLYGREQPAII
jgi:hypothetical protein